MARARITDFQALAFFSIACSVLPLTAQAKNQTAGDVVLSYSGAWNACDTQKLQGLLQPDVSMYGVSAGLAKSSDAVVESLKRQCALGTRSNLTYELLDVVVSSDAAVVVAFATGTLTFADGKTAQNPLRATFFLQKAAQQPWRIRHIHFSGYKR